MTRLYRAFLVAFLMAFIAAAAVAQVTSSANDVATPIEGKGHDYIKLLSETVNPSNGSVSLRIELPVPESRGFTVPFALAYDSSTEHHLVYNAPNPFLGLSWTNNYAALAQGGWSYTFPQISWNEWEQTRSVYDGGASSGSEHWTTYRCATSNGYVLHGMGGETYSLYMGGEYPAGPEGGCGGGGVARSSGDFADGVWGILRSWGTGILGTQYTSTWPEMVGDKHGNIYTFNNPAFPVSVDAPVTMLPDTIEDRNGNKFTITLTGTPNPNGTMTYTRGRFTAKDTNGRTVISSQSEFGTTGTISVGGRTYGLGWMDERADFGVDHTTVRPSESYYQCHAFPRATDTNTVISEIDLPNGQSYRFLYGSTYDPGYQNPYGLLSEIVYPSGTWVKYKWKQSDTMSDVLVYPGSVCTEANPAGTCIAYGPVADGCAEQYRSPVVASREVGLAGSSTPILTQTFTYSTSWDGSNLGWTSKTTNVTTTDNVTGLSTLTSYTYAPIWLPNQPFDYTSYPKQAAVERSVTYYEGASDSSRRLRMVEKEWLDQYRLKSEKVTLENNTSSLKRYSYAGVMPSEVVEYDYNNSTTPVRKTVTSYQSFSGTMGTLLDKPCRVTTYDGSGISVAETSYHYDGGSVPCGAAGTPSVVGVAGLDPVTHDEEHFSASSSTPRGNVTAVIRKCSPNCSDSQPTTRYAYDSTGQVISRIDSKGNPTQYSYADRYTVSSGDQNGDYAPPYATNAFVTTITRPPTDGGILTEQFKYDYQNSQLTQRKDSNSQVTDYFYNDVFARIKQIKAPDGAQTTLSYNDLPYSSFSNTPSVTTTRKISGSQNLVSTSATDGMGHVVRTIADSYPGGPMIVDMTYNGVGTLRSVSNPHRSGASQGGLTTYDYDAIGRQVLLTHQDNTRVQTQYDGNTTTITDETSRQRNSEVDALGRLVKVTEPNPETGSLSSGALITSYTYDALNNLKSVLQNGSRQRTFTYDSLSQLRSATNPESGTTSYTYDPNGNLSLKTAPSPYDGSALTVTTNYTYDNLNRLKAKQYSNSANAETTPSTCFQYDQSSSGTVTNGAGRLVNEWTQSGACSSQPPPNAITRRSLSYDATGQVTGETQCTPFNCNVGGRSPYSITHGYDFLGNETLHTNGIGSISFAAEYNGANLLRSLSSSWDDTTHPANLFSAPDASAYGPAGLNDALFGSNLNLHREYDARLRLASETDTGYIPIPATAASAQVQIRGPEQQKAVPTASTGTISIAGGYQPTHGTATVVINESPQPRKQTQTAAPATGSLTVDGNEITWETETSPAAYASGYVRIRGTLQARQVKTASATFASTTLTLYNDGSQVYTYQCYMPYQTNCPVDYYNYSAFWLDGMYVGPGGYSWTSEQVAQNMARDINSKSSSLSAYSYSNTVTIYSKATGSNTNRTLSYFCSWDTDHFSSCPVETIGSLTLSGGHDDIYSTTYDTGTFRVTVNGQTFSRDWGPGSTAESIARALASDITANSPVSANPTGSGDDWTITLTSKQSGAGGNYTLAAYTTFNTGTFDRSSFSVENSPTITGGTNAVKETHYDSGTTTVTYKGHTTSYTWGNASWNRTKESIAAEIAKAIHDDAAAFVDARAVNNTVNLTARTSEKVAAGSITSLTSSPRGSFNNSTTAVWTDLGRNDEFISDHGTAEITVNGQTFSTSWSLPGDGGSTIAAALAGSISRGSSDATATATGTTIKLTTLKTGSNTGYPLQVRILNDSGNFPQTSFSAAVVPSGAATFTPGADSSPVVHESGGTAVLAVGSSSFSIPYVRTDTAESIVSKMASQLGSCSGSAPIWGSPSGTSLKLTSCGKGTSVNYPLSFTTSYDASYSAPMFPNSSANMTGGTDDGATVYDKGTVTLRVHVAGSDVTGSTNYGQNSTPASVAAGLASAFSGNPRVKVEQVSSGSDSIRIMARTPGEDSNNITYVVDPPTYDVANFSSASFSATPNSGSLSGGRREDRARSAVYTYVVNYHGNGNVSSVNDSVMGTWSYPNDGYDPLNRLTKAVSSSGPYGGITINWSYDAWGNRLNQTPTSPDNGLVPYSWAHYDNNPSHPNNGTNRVISAPERPAGYDYSSSGNVLNDGRNQYTYDAENRIVRTVANGVTTQYVYDAEGRRVAKLNESNAVTASYVLGLGGEQMTEMGASGNWVHTNAYAGGKLMATYDNQGVHFHANDWLGTRRVQTGYDGTLELAFRSLPFGDGLATDPYASSGDSTEHHFTAKERDAETGNDYFGARYYSSNMGRFSSPDEPLADQSQGDPQSWNLYSYVRNNPLINIDPSGNDCVYLNNSGNGVESVDQQSSSGECGKTGGYWVDGSVTNVQTDNDSVTLTGTKNGSDTTHSSYLTNGDKPLNSFAQGVFSQPVMQATAATMTDPRTYALFYAGSGALGACAVGCPAAASAALTAGRSLYYAAAGLLPAVPSAITKLQKLGMSIPEANELINSPTTQRLIDNSNGGNINYIAEIGGRLIRITTDPTGQRIISAGMVRANQIANGIANGRFVK